MIKVKINILQKSLMFFCLLLLEKVAFSQNSLELIPLNDMEDAFYANPSNIDRMGDPYIVKHNLGDQYYYLYATYKSNEGAHAWRSTDLKNWSYRGCFHYISKTTWALNEMWGPKVHKVGDKYFLYYSARLKVDPLNTSGDISNNRLMIGAAVGNSPVGPFTDLGQPLFDFGYAVIDNHVFIDEDGSKYFLFSRDCSTNIFEGRNESHMYICRLADDMLTLVGDPVLLTRPTQSWWEFLSGNEWRWNEGSEMIKYKGMYYFMWSANYYATKFYSIGFATSNNPFGPFTKSNLNPVLQEYNDNNGFVVSGPGNGKIFKSPDLNEFWFTYHSHTYPLNPSWDRQLCIDRMGFRTDGSIYINGPTLTKQPVPSGVNGYVNIANKATISVSSTLTGYSSSAINDGETGLWEKYEKYEWKSNNERINAFVSVHWDTEQTINSILIYNSAIKTRRVSKGKIIFEDGNEIPLVFSNVRGEAAIACFKPYKTTGFKFVVTEMAVNGTTAVGLSEIMVLSRQDINMGVNKNKSEITSIFPNPSNGLIHIKGISDLKTVSIYNLYGQKLYQTHSSGQLDVTFLQNGLYYLRIDDNYSTSFVKQ